MPSATRNTKPNSGTAGSAPGKPNRKRNTSAEIPNVAAKDRMLAASSTAGATRLRSSRARTTKMTMRTTGMILYRSDVDTSSTSSC